MHEEHQVRAGKHELHIELLKGTDSAFPILGQVPDQLLDLWRVVRGESRHAGRQGVACATGVQQSTLLLLLVASAATVPKAASKAKISVYL